MFKPSSLLAVLISVGLAAPLRVLLPVRVSILTLGLRKFLPLKLRHRRRQPPLKLRPLKNSNAPSVPLIAGQADELKIAADNFKTRYPKTKVLAYRLTPLAGIFEATVGKEVIYFDKTARFVFSAVS